MRDHVEWKRSWVAPVAIFTVMAVGLAGAALLNLRGFERDLRSQIERELSGIADLKVLELVDWRQRLLDEGASLAERPFVGRALADVLRGSADEPARREVTALLVAEARRQRLAEVTVVRVDGEPLLGRLPGDGRAAPARWLGEPCGKGRVVLVDIPGRPGEISLVVPARPEGAPPGCVLLTGYLGKALPRTVYAWPSPSSTAEAFLGAVEGDVVELAAVLHNIGRESPPTSVSVASALPIALAARGEVGVGPLRDYRGVTVIAARRRIPNSPWALVAKVDEAEILAPTNERARALAGLVGLLLVTAAGGLLFWWRVQIADLAQRQRELEERALQSRLDYLWKHANDIILIAGPDGRILEANDRAMEAHGLSRAELLELRYQDLVAPEAQGELPALEARLREEGALRFEAVHRRRDGTTFPVECSVRAFDLPGGQGLYLVARDIVDRKQAEKAMRLQSSVLSQLNDGVIAVDREMRVTAWTGAAERIYGFAAREALGRPVRELVGAADDPTRVPELQAKLEAGGAQRVLRVHRNRQGDPIDVETTTVALRGGDGKVVGYLGVHRDVTERRRAEQALRLQEERLRLALDVTEVGIGDVDLRSGQVYLSPRLAAMVGQPEGSVRAMALLDLVHPQDLERVRHGLADLLAGRTDRLESEYRVCVQGAVIWQRCHARIVDREDDRPTRMLATVADITRERRMHAQLVFADRLASIGTLAAGVAHEINNPLSYLVASFEFLEERLSESGPGAWDEEAKEAVREARDGARRIADIVRGLRIFSQRERERAPSVIDVREPVRAAARIAETQVRPRARLVLDLQDVPPVSAREHELAQVAVNLIVNAAHSIPEGAVLLNEVRVTTRLAEDGRVALEVKDTGSGIPPEIMSRIFDPFFTTKSVGEGSGLGLSICHGIVQALGGEITVESALGKGTRFRVLLPAAVWEDKLEPEEAPSPAVRRGRVLVLDDEPMVCRAVARILDHDHEVVALTEPGEALDLLRHGERFDLVLCDLMMPGLTGMQLHEALLASRPELVSRMVFLTGGAFTPEARAFLERVPNARIDKPFEADRLREVVAREVGQQAA